MEFDLSSLPNEEAYALLIGVVVPRPIAFVTTLGTDGKVNAAPFSFFNMLSNDPAIVALGLGARPEGPLKDTARNIEETREFVVNMVDEEIAEAMVRCATDFPNGMEELAIAGLDTAPSRTVKPPRIAQSPIHLECTRHMTLEFGKRRSIILGEVRHLHIRDDLLDRDRRRVRQDRLRLVARLGGHGYCRMRDQFEIKRESYASWLARQPATAK